MFVSSLLLLLFFLSIYLDVQPQETQALTVSISEFVNMCSLNNGLMKYKDSHGNKQSCSQH